MFCPIRSGALGVLSSSVASRAANFRVASNDINFIFDALLEMIGTKPGGKSVLNIIETSVEIIDLVVMIVI